MRQRLAELTTSQRSRRRQVTVMFADVKGYSTLVEKLDPEWVGELVDRLWGELGRLVRRQRRARRPALPARRHRAALGRAGAER